MFHKTEDARVHSRVHGILWYKVMGQLGPSWSKVLFQEGMRQQNDDRLGQVGPTWPCWDKLVPYTVSHRAPRTPDSILSHPDALNQTRPKCTTVSRSQSPAICFCKRSPEKRHAIHFHHRIGGQDLGHSEKRGRGDLWQAQSSELNVPSVPAK